MAYGYFKDLARGTASYVLRDKPFKIAKNPNYDEYQRSHASKFYEFLDKNALGSGFNNEKK